MTISMELLDELLTGVERPEDLLGDAGLLKELKIRLMERMLGGERPRIWAMRKARLPRRASRTGGMAPRPRG